MCAAYTGIPSYVGRTSRLSIEMWTALHYEFQCANGFATSPSKCRLMIDSDGISNRKISTNKVDKKTEYPKLAKEIFSRKHRRGNICNTLKESLV